MFTPRIITILGLGLLYFFPYFSYSSLHPFTIPHSSLSLFLTSHICHYSSLPHFTITYFPKHRLFLLFLTPSFHYSSLLPFTIPHLSYMSLFLTPSFHYSSPLIYVTIPHSLISLFLTSLNIDYNNLNYNNLHPKHRL